MRPIFLWFQNQTHTKNTSDKYLHEYSHKYLHQNVSIPYPAIYKMIYIHDKMSLMQRMQVWLITQKAIHIIHYINRIKDKIHMIFTKFTWSSQKGRYLIEWTLTICKVLLGEGTGTPLQFLPGKSHGWRSLEGCSPWGCWGSDRTERLHFHFSLSCIGEGNGNPLQCSCLENPRNGGA